MRAWMWTVLGAWILASGGCNCIIDADQYRGRPGDGGGNDAPDNLPDALGADARADFDAGPIDPLTAREGEGSGAGAPPFMVALRGQFAPGTTVRVVVSGGDTDLVALPAEVSADGSLLAFGIRIPVDEDLGEGDTATLSVYIDEGDGEDLYETLTVEGLDEADLAGAVDTATLRPLYSRITVSDPVALAGASPAILRSTTDITLSADLVADGKQGGAAGPGGCPGGGSGQPGGCDIHGGAGGASGTLGFGGGGGGHAQVGNPATGGADGGEPSGDPMLAPLAAEGGNGGGGGGDGLLGLGSGGAGGGGGGVVELSAAGTVTIDAVVDASGGNGTPAGGTCGVNAGGSGGGGSGGAVLVRGTAIAGTGSLDATRGNAATTCSAGGNGSPGRIRIDAASEALPALTVQPSAVRGPHWADDTPSLVREAQLELTLHGQPNRTFAARVGFAEPVEVETTGSGAGTITVTLEPGHNRVCTVVSPTADLSLPEAVRCRFVTYVP